MKHQEYIRKTASEARKEAVIELIFYSAVIVIIVGLVMVTR